ncbi:hypothetical protein Franean1_4420 [Parafrankia sp. EAN1pec]|nr:hypothetical protein Franean1_4420 [Frankia sp. EAN1pec]
MRVYRRCGEEDRGQERRGPVVLGDPTILRGLWNGPSADRFPIAAARLRNPAHRSKAMIHIVVINIMARRLAGRINPDLARNSSGPLEARFRGA